MSKIELKFGREVIAWNFANEKVPGLYIYNDRYSICPHEVYTTDLNMVSSFRNVEPDPDGAPMNGDEVEALRGSETKTWFCAKYCGIDPRNPTLHIVLTEMGELKIVSEVRHPQPEPTKREKVENLMDQVRKYGRIEATNQQLANEIDKIYSEVNDET